MARPFLADPELMRKSALGKNEDVRPCVRCNTCCGRSAFFKKTRCAINPINGREVDYPNGKVPKTDEKKKVVIVGGGMTGAECALNLARQGKTVTMIEMMGPEALLHGASLINRFSLQSLLMKHQVRILPHTKLEEVTDTGIKTINSKFHWQEHPADTVVLALGMKPRKDVVAQLRHLIPPTEVYVIGDCHQVGNVYSAVHAGFDTAAVI